MDHDRAAAKTELEPAACSRRLFLNRQQHEQGSTISHQTMEAQARTPSGPHPRWRQPIFIISSAILFTILNTCHGLQLQQAVAKNWTANQLPFGSTRYVYPRSSQRANGINHRQVLNSHYRYDMLATSGVETRPQVDIVLRNQLTEMREKFEDQLAASSGRRQVALGSPCLSSKDCSSHVENSHCRLDNYTCSCLANHVEHNSTTCLPSALLGFKCSIDSQCERRVANSFCSPATDQSNNSGGLTSEQHKICSCKSNFIAYRRDKCLPGSPINEYCLSNEQCRLNDRHSYCQWRITNIYGTCKCPPNYKQLRTSSSPSLSSSTSTGKEDSGLKCVPRLGDACLSDDECQLATPNSLCRDEATREEAVSLSWKTSQANSRRRCLCQSGFVVSPNKLDCLSLTVSGSDSEVATTSIVAVNSRNKSDLESNFTAATIVTFGDFGSSTTPMDKRQPQYDLVISPPTTTAATTTTNQPNTTTTTTTTTTKAAAAAAAVLAEAKPTAPTHLARLSVSSLGKTCNSTAECQRRDPHSACLAGICDCLRPTSRCRADSTGCHGDTFQCRNGQCISWYFVCDQFKNCADGSDEDECQWAQCPPEAFQCANGQCLARSKVCNGRRDCSDGSDELRCSVAVAAKEQPTTALHRDQSADEKLSQHQVVAGDWLSPEGAKNSTSAGCHPKAFTCSNGQCLPAYVFCNAVQDCSDGSDELEQLCGPHSRRGAPVQPTKEDGQRQQEKQTSAGGGSSLVLRPNETGAKNNNNNNKTNANTLPAATGTGTGTGTGANRDPAKPSSGSKPNLLLLEDSPLVKADRLDINKMLASLKLPNKQTTPTPAKLRQELVESRLWLSRRRSRLLTEPARRRQPKLDDDEDECPRGTFTCANGKCRSTAILCSGVDGCGDDSDENQCEVCQCEAP